MARLGTLACIRLLALVLMMVPGSMMAQSACTDEQAKEKHGSLALDRSNQSLLDSERRFKPDPAAQRKIDQAIAILKQAIPDITGGEGLYSYSFSTPQPKRILVFSIRAGLFAYYCMPASYPGAHPGRSLGRMRRGPGLRRISTVLARSWKSDRTWGTTCELPRGR
jgi:hypothetical protein